jgi:hypothetical protein
MVIEEFMKKADDIISSKIKTIRPQQVLTQRHTNYYKFKFLTTLGGAARRLAG